MKIFKLWILPLLLAVILVVFLNIFMYDFYVVNSDNMNNTLKRNDIVLIRKHGKIRRGNIILLNKNNQKLLSRCVALPGDTLIIHGGTIYVNRKKLKLRKHPKPFVMQEFVFKTDSLKPEIFDSLDIAYNKKTAHFGVYKFTADRQILKYLNEYPHWKTKRKETLPKSVFDDRSLPFINRFYWNPDNTGQIIIPFQGMQTELTPYNYELYKSVMKKETGKTPHRNKNQVFINGKTAKRYTFINNYYFIINDNRTVLGDSRNTGFISETQIAGKVIFKLPAFY